MCCIYLKQMQMKYHEHALGTQRFLPLGTRFHFLLPLDSALRTGADMFTASNLGWASLQSWTILRFNTLLSANSACAHHMVSQKDIKRWRFTAVNLWRASLRRWEILHLNTLLLAKVPPGLGVSIPQSTLDDGQCWLIDIFVFSDSPWNYM